MQEEISKPPCGPEGPDNVPGVETSRAGGDDVRPVAGEADDLNTKRPMTEEERIDVRSMMRRAAIALVILVLISLLGSWLFRDWLEEVGQYLIGKYGGRGVFTSVFFIDWFPLPTSSEPVYMLGVSSGMDLVELFIASAAGSVVAAMGCYASGAVLDRTTSIGDWVRTHHPALIRWVEEHGFRGLALAALVPLPFAPMMWTAGIIGRPLEQVVVISLLRIPKTVFYLVVILASWKLT